MSVDNLFVPKQGLLSDLADLLAGQLATAVVRLYANNVVYTPNRVPADYTEASFVGYAPIGAVAWGVPFVNSADKAESDSPILTWTFTGAIGTHVVFGAYITDPGLTKLLRVIPFIMPFTFAPVTPVLQRVVQLVHASEL